MVVPATLVIVLGFLPQEAKIWSFALLVIAAGSSSAMYSGHAANVYDLTLTFPGIIKGVSNSISNVFNILPPFTVEMIVADEVSVLHCLKNQNKLQSKVFASEVMERFFKIPVYYLEYNKQLHKSLLEISLAEKVIR